MVWIARARARGDAGDSSDNEVLEHAQVAAGPPSAALVGTGSTIRRRFRFATEPVAEMAES